MNEIGTDDQLREIVGRLIEQAPAPLPYSALGVDADLVTERALSLDRFEPSPGRLRLRPALIVAAASIVAVAAVVGYSTWNGATNETIIVGVAESTASSQAEAPVNEQIATEPQSFEWSRVPHDNDLFAGGVTTVMNSVVAGGPGLVAVGNSDLAAWPDPPLGIVTAAVWTSVDGADWSRVPYDPEIFNGPGGIGMSDITVGGPGLVAVGSGGEVGSTDSAAAVWTSIDGLTWTRIPYEKETFGDDSSMASVTVGGPGLVAVGSASGDAAVWTSTDGSRWSRVAHDEETFGDARMQSVTPGGPGLVAVGSGAAWTSVDGFTWSRVAGDQETFNGAQMQSVTNGGPGLVAVGWTDAGSGVWTSIDGLGWTRVPGTDVLPGGDAFPFVVVNVGDGLLAVGSINIDTGAAFWSSVDGITWVQGTAGDSVVEDGAMSDVAVFGSGLVAVGGTLGDPDLLQYTTAAIWTASVRE